MAYSVEWTSEAGGPASTYLAIDGGMQECLRQAATYLRSGFGVLCIKDDAGNVVMDEAAVRQAVFPDRSTPLEIDPDKRE